MNKWIEKARASLADAIEKAEVGEIPLQNLYMLAPILYSQEHHTNNNTLYQEMTSENDERVAEDWSHDEKSKDQYKFHYVSSYLFCFVVAGKIDEMKYDQIMNYVCMRLDLFSDDYYIE